MKRNDLSYATIGRHRMSQDWQWCCFRDKVYYHKLSKIYRVNSLDLQWKIAWRMLEGIFLEMMQSLMKNSLKIMPDNGICDLLNVEYYNFLAF